MLESKNFIFFVAANLKIIKIALFKGLQDAILIRSSLSNCRSSSAVEPIYTKITLRPLCLCGEFCF